MLRDACSQDDPYTARHLAPGSMFLEFTSSLRVVSLQRRGPYPIIFAHVQPEKTAVVIRIHRHRGVAVDGRRVCDSVPAMSLLTADSQGPESGKSPPTVWFTLHHGVP